MSEEELEQPTVVSLTPEQQWRKIIIPFFGAVGAGADSILCSDQIGYRYRITKIEIHFRDDTANLLQVGVFAGGNRQIITDTPPSGTNVIGRFTPTPYVVGQGQTIVIDCNYIPSYEEVYLKAYLNNLAAYAMTGMVLITIESITEDEALTLVEESRTNIAIRTPEKYMDELYHKGIANLNVITDIRKGTDPRATWSIGNFTGEALVQKGTYYDDFMNLLNIPDILPPSVPIEDRYKFTKAWVDGVTEMTYDLSNKDQLIDAFASGFGGSVTDFGDWFKNTFPLQDKVKELLGIVIDKAFISPVEGYWNNLYRPEIPDVQELINERVKEKLTLEQFERYLGFKGFSKFWSDQIWDAHFRAPDFTEVRQAIWREGILHDEIVPMMERVDLDPYYNEKVWNKLLYEIPPYTDLINMLVKEVITQEDFDKAIQGHGFYPPWGSRLWDAHFTPPTFEDFLLAMRRKQSVHVPQAEGEGYDHTFGGDFFKDVEVIKELSVLADYDPRYWSFFVQRIFNDPTARQARWGYETGAIDETEVRSIVDRSGLADRDAAWFTEMLITFQERPFITRYLNGLMDAYLKEAITEDELKKRVTAIPRRESIADWIIQIADLRKEVAGTPEEISKEKLLSLGELKRMFTLALISEDDFRTRLQLLGYELVEIQLLIELTEKIKEESESGAQKRALSVSEMFNAFKWWQISEQDLRDNLMLRGLTLQEANLLIESKKTQWIIKEKWSETKPIS